MPGTAARFVAGSALALAVGLALAAGWWVELAAAGRPLAAQELALAGLSGERLAESDLARGTTVVVVWASWSPRSRNIVERVNAIAGRWQPKARVVTVDFQEDPRAVEAFLAGKRLTVPVYLDPEGALAKKYAIATLPGLLVLKDGQVAYRGQLPDDPDRVLARFLQ
jgi:thiol-disulfide isomerase/thioredoxin